MDAGPRHGDPSLQFRCLGAVLGRGNRITSPLRSKGVGAGGAQRVPEVLGQLSPFGDRWRAIGKQQLIGIGGVCGGPGCIWPGMVTAAPDSSSPWQSAPVCLDQSPRGKRGRQTLRLSAVPATLRGNPSGARSRTDNSGKVPGIPEAAV